MNTKGMNRAEGSSLGGKAQCPAVPSGSTPPSPAMCKLCNHPTHSFRCEELVEVFECGVAWDEPCQCIEGQSTKGVK